MARLGVYDPGEVSVIVGGRRIDGYAEGTMIESTRTNPLEMSAAVGARGEYALQVNRDKSGTVNLVLSPESPSNAYLSTLAAARSIVPMAILRNGETVKELITAPEAWVQELPQKSFDAEAPSRTWVIGVGDMQSVDTTL